MCLTWTPAQLCSAARSTGSPGVRRGRMLLPRLFWLVLAPALTVLLSCSPAPEQEKQVAPFEPPPAEAPPDAGVPPPQVRLHVPGGPPLSAEERPQRQLVDWSEALADGLNIPRAALQAYGYAQRALEQS